jgi:hypothetical protein
MAQSVIIIGNGFDLNLGLPTSYQDFMSSSFFTDNLNSGNSLFDYLSEKNNIQSWIDIETELATYSDNLNEGSPFFKEYSLLCESLKSYLNTLDFDEINHESVAYEFLVNTFDKDTIILNFNYTNTVQYILTNNKFSKKLISKNVKHIHGSVKDNNIIFGIDDNSRINPNDTFLYKSTSKYYNGREVRLALNDFEKLAVFGHSLGESDHMYLKTAFFRLSQNNSLEKDITMYYHTENGKFQLYKQLHKLTHSGVSGLKDNVNFHEFDTASNNANKSLKRTNNSWFLLLRRLF